MKITVICDHCGAKLSVDAAYAGKTGKCPKCKEEIKVPPVQDPQTNGDAELSCPKCGKPYMEGQSFCDHCGRPLEAKTVRKKIKRVSSKYARKHAKETMKSLLMVRLVIIGVALLNFIGAFMVYNEISEVLGDQPIPPLGYALISSPVIIGMIYLGLFFWAKGNPFGATLTALIIFITFQMVNFAIEPSTLAQGVYIKGFILAALIGGVYSGLSYRRYRAKGVV
ncbi:MAG: zinc ribbon domain-containing protein [Planctomycetota bacterium]